MKYVVFDRDSLRIEEIVSEPRTAHLGKKFIVLPVSDDQEQFRKALNALKVSALEVALMYRHAAGISDPLTIYRSDLISKLYRVVTEGNPCTKDSATLWEGEAGSQQGPTGRDRRATNTVAPAKTPSAPRGGNRAAIFEVADRMWNEAGSPKDVSVVLALRKTIMNELEENYGIRRTTSSTALGDWQKLRLNG